MCHISFVKQTGKTCQQGNFPKDCQGQTSKNKTYKNRTVGTEQNSLQNKKKK